MAMRQSSEPHPVTGDTMIWDTEPDATIYWVNLQGRGSAAQIFEGASGWARAYAAARTLAGPNGVIWKRHLDGRYEKLASRRCKP
jgi:hypothetical protein